MSVAVAFSQVRFKLYSFCREALMGRTSKRKQISHVNKKSATSYSEAKQKQLEALCEKLFQQNELVSTGKLRVLGLNKVKRKLGKSWDGLKPLVFDAVESSIQKYISPADIFIRYKDDTYVIIFAEARLEEAEIRIARIVEEIRRQLFDYRNDDLAQLEFKESVSQVETSLLRRAGGFHDRLEIIMAERERQAIIQGLTTRQTKRTIWITFMA